MRCDWRLSQIVNLRGHNGAEDYSSRLLRLLGDGRKTETIKLHNR